MSESTNQIRPRAGRRKIVLWGMIVGIGLCVVGVILRFTLIPFGEFCGWNATGQAWLDEDANGIWDESEPPLEGVRFHVAFAESPETDDLMEETRTDFRGDAALWMGIMDCSRQTFVIYPDVPQGYRLTTEASAKRSTGQQDTQIPFGFAYLPGAPTVTPRPAAPVCTTYFGTIEGTDLRADNLFSLSPAPDGTMWFWYYGGGCCHHQEYRLVQYIPSTGEWKDHSLPEYEDGRTVTGYSITVDNVLWLLIGKPIDIQTQDETAEPTDTQILRYDGSEWETVTFDDAPFDGNAIGISVAPDGKLWFTYEYGLATYDPESETWESTETTAGKLYNLHLFLPDGRALFSVYDEESLSTRLLLFTSLEEEPEAVGRVYDYFLNAIKVAPDGALWVATFEGIERIDLESGDVQVLDAETTGGKFTSYANDLAFAPDGSVWIASSAGDVPAAYHYIPPPQGQQIGIWRVYDQRDGIPEQFAEETDGNVLREVEWQEGVVWFKEDTALVQCKISD